MLVAPVTVPYVRYSIRSSHWFVAQALQPSVEGIQARQVRYRRSERGQLYAGAGYGDRPHTASRAHGALARSHSARGRLRIVALRRALRAVQAGDAEVVACIGADTNHVDSFRQSLGSFSVFARDAVFPYGSGGPNASFAFLTSYYMRAVRRDARRLRQALRRAARQRARLPARPVQEDAHARGVSRCAADRRPHPPVRLRHALCRRRGFSGHDPAAGARRSACPTRVCARPASATTRFPTIRSRSRGGWVLDRDHLYGAAGVEPSDIDFVQTYDDYPVMSLIQLEDLGLLREGRGSRVRSPPHLHRPTAHFPSTPAADSSRWAKPAARRGFLGLVESIRQLTAATSRAACPTRASGSRWDSA